MSVGWARGLEGGGRKGVGMKDEAEEVKNLCKPSKYIYSLLMLKSCEKYRILPIFYST